MHCTYVLYSFFTKAKDKLFILTLFCITKNEFDVHSTKLGFCQPSSLSHIRVAIPTKQGNIDALTTQNKSKDLRAITCSTTEKYCSEWVRVPSTHLKVRTTSYVQHNKQYQMKELLNSFHLNGHTLGFYSQT